MSDDRTTEEREADAALAAAIETAVRAYGHIEPGTFITQWVVLGQAAGVSDLGHDMDNRFVVLPDNGATLPWYQLVGMLRVHTLAIEADYLRAPED